jgi:peptidoglycan/LPS O-acetylase OafA/YrhL
VTSRNQSLDVLRGIAVLMVALTHYAEDLNHDGLMYTVGTCGVDLFFVLSGFLISGLLFSEYKRTGKIDAKRFWIRRGFKIYPPFYFFLATTVFGLLVLTHRPLRPQALFAELVFLQSYVPHLWPHTWSLAVEEHFYFLLPLLLMLFIRVNTANRNPFRWIPLISIVSSCICFYLRFLAMHRGAIWEQVSEPTHLRIDALLSGVTLGYYSHFQQESFCEARRRWVLVVGILLSSTLIVLPQVMRLTIAYPAFCFVVAWAVNRNHSENLLVRAFAWVGYYSYSIYLWHVVLVIVLPFIPSGWYRLPSYAAGVILIGVFFAKAIEVPALRFRDKVFPSNKAPRSRKSVTPLPSLQPMSG